MVAPTFDVLSSHRTHAQAAQVDKSAEEFSSTRLKWSAPVKRGIADTLKHPPEPVPEDPHGAGRARMSEARDKARKSLDREQARAAAGQYTDVREIAKDMSLLGAKIIFRGDDSVTKPQASLCNGTVTVRCPHALLSSNGNPEIEQAELLFTMGNAYLFDADRRSVEKPCSDANTLARHRKTASLMTDAQIQEVIKKKFGFSFGDKFDSIFSPFGFETHLSHGDQRRNLEWQMRLRQEAVAAERPHKPV